MIKTCKNINSALQKIEVLSATQRYCSGSLHTLSDCKKCIESTVRIQTDVKPVIFNGLYLQCSDMSGHPLLQGFIVNAKLFLF